MNGVLLNFSGHGLSVETKNELLQRFEEIEDIPFFEIDFSGDVEIQLKRILNEVKTPLDGSVPISFIPPGQATMSILLIVFLYGLLGYFPGICLLEAKNSGNYAPTNVFFVDGHQLRKAGRMFRQIKWKKEGNSSLES